MWFGESNSELELYLEPPVRPAARRAKPVAPAIPDTPPVALLGVPFDPLTGPELLARVEAMIASGRPHYLVTANVDFLVQSLADVELRRVLIDADLVLCDGTPLVWASRWLGNGLPERVAGSDVVPELIRRAAERGWRIFFLGGQPAIADRALARLREQYPGLVASAYSPPFQPLAEMDFREIRRRIHAARPQLLLVSFGCPKAEKWMAMNHRLLGVPVSIGVGATIDFLAGAVTRAPRWMQRAGLEWVHRLWQEPRRLGPRYARDLPRFVWALARQSLALQRDPRQPRGRRAGGLAVRMAEPTWQLIQARGALDAAAVRRGLPSLGELDARHCLLDLAEVSFLDSTGVGFLVHWQKQLQARGRHLVLLLPSRAVRRALGAMHLEHWFLTAHDIVEARWRIEARQQQAQGAVVPASDSPTQPWCWRGEITAANAGRVWRRVRRQINFLCLRHAELAVDLSGVRFLDTTGARLLVQARAVARRYGSRLTFTGVTPDVTNVLQRSGLAGRVLAD